MEVTILPDDHLNYMTSDEKCSRCRKDIKDGDVPLRLWPESDTNFMYIYCDGCSKEVLNLRGS